MCLIANKDNPKDESIFEFNEEGYTYCWKIYTLENGVLKPWLYGSKNIKPGWINSNRQTTRVPIETDSTNFHGKLIVERGIHVSLTIPNAKHQIVVTGDTLVKVRCYKNDLVATGIGDHGGCEAVFNKVFLDEKEYNKVVGD